MRDLEAYGHIRKRAKAAKVENQWGRLMIDWNSVWKLALLASRQGNLENGYEKEEAAERYDRSEIARQDGERRTAALEIDPSWSVLDSSSVPGALALPFSQEGETSRGC